MLNGIKMDFYYLDLLIAMLNGINGTRPALSLGQNKLIRAIRDDLTCGKQPEIDSTNF